MSSFAVEADGGVLWTAVILSLILSPILFLILYCCCITMKEGNEDDVYSRQITRLRTHKCECLRCQCKK